MPIPFLVSIIEKNVSFIIQYSLYEKYFTTYNRR